MTSTELHDGIDASVLYLLKARGPHSFGELLRTLEQEYRQFAATYDDLDESMTRLALDGRVTVVSYTEYPLRWRRA